MYLWDYCNYFSDIGRDDIVLDGDGEDSIVAQQTPQSETPTTFSSSTHDGFSRMLSPMPSQPGPSHSSGETSQHSQGQNLDTLLSLFSSRFTTMQIQVLYWYSGDNFDNTIECLMNGPLDSIVRMINTHSMTDPVVKVAIDSDDVWADILAIYIQVV